MAILDIQRLGKGIQSLDFHDDSSAIPGRGDIMLHTSGLVVCVWAANYLAGVTERRLYFATSSDGGTTWSARAEITSGHWDDNPAIVQIDPSDESSDIGICFTRSEGWDNTNSGNISNLHRMTVSLEGEVPEGINPVPLIDPPDTTIQNRSSLSLVQTDDNFVLSCLDRTSRNLYTYSNAIVEENDHRGFTDNAWSMTTTQNPSGDAQKPVVSLKVRKFSQGYCMIVGFQSAINGETSWTRANLRHDIGVRFSTDLTTWSSLQALTAYTGNPKLDLTGIDSATNGDVTELSDGTLAVMFQESEPFQFARNNSLTDPSNTGAYVLQVLYHPVHNLLVIGCYNQAATNGLWLLDLDTGLETRLTTSSTPRIWNQNINRITLSSDYKYLAVASEAALDIFDTTDATIANWTVVSLQTTTTLARPSGSDLYTGNIEWCAFDGTTTLYFGYKGASRVSRCWGGRVNAGSLAGSLVDMMADSGAPTNLQALTSKAQVSITGTYVIFPAYGRLCATNKTTGAGAFNTGDLGITAFGGYDDINDRFIYSYYISGADKGLKVFSIQGAAFTTISTFTPSSTPSVPDQADQCFTIPGSGIMFLVSNYSNEVTPVWYSFAEQKPLGIVHLTIDNIASLFFGLDAAGIPTLTPDRAWILGVNPYLTSGIQALPTTKSGRLRWSAFDYNSETKQLETSGIDWYDAANALKLGDDINHVRDPRITATDADQLVVYGQFLAPARTGRQFGCFIGAIQPDAQKLDMRARIRKTWSYPDWDKRLGLKGCIRINPSVTIAIRARLVRASCIKMQARIVPRATLNLGMKGCVLNTKTTLTACSFYVQQSGRNRSARLSFWIVPGYTRSTTLSMLSRVAQTASTRATCHFLVPGATLGTESLTTSTETLTHRIVGLRCRISR